MTTTVAGVGAGRREGGRLAWPLVLLVGALVGAVWGVLARGWMWLIAEDPEPTTAGTVGVVASFAVAGLGASGMYLGRRRGTAGWRSALLRTAGVLSILPLVGGAGLTMAPVLFCVPLAVTRRRWPILLRVLVALPAVLCVWATWKYGLVDIEPHQVAIGLVGLVVVYAGLCWAAAFTLAPWGDERFGGTRG